MRVLKFNENFTGNKKKQNKKPNEGIGDFNVTESFWDDDDEVLVVTIEAIHALTTENYNTYLASELRGNIEERTGVYSWTYPYNKPVLTHHNSRRGERVGRVVEAEFTENSTTGKPAIVLTVEILEENAVDKVKDGRYETVSIGGRAEIAECSICGQDWISEGWCEHWPGEEYDGEVCTIKLRNLTFVEVSFVNVPADSYARVIDVDESSGEEKETDENLEIKNGKIQQKENMQGGNKMDPKELQTKVGNLQESVSVKEDKIEALETQNNNLQSKVETLESEKNSIKEKKEVLDTKVENLNNELDSLTEENNNLKEKLHKHLAEKVVDKKIELDKIDEESREEELEEHINRTEDSLNDTLKDLRKESKRIQEEQVNPPMGEEDNPGLRDSGEENNVDVNNEEDDDEFNEEEYKDIL